MGDSKVSGEQRKYLRPTEAAEELGCSRSFIYKLMDDKHLAYVRMGNMRRIRRQDLEAYILANLVNG